ncbi:Cyclic di-GMP phosphodiesterase Gmr [Thalassocella blandensis]|nr:Cyclic di-GMP phosphodiesterase Gmr [Thalassocella blandensis]
MNTLSFSGPFYTAYLRRACLYFLAICAVISCVYLVFSYSQYRVDQKNLILTEQQMLRKTSDMLLQEMTPHASILTDIVQSPGFQQFVISDSEVLLPFINSEFENLVTDSPRYTSIQYLDNLGNLKIRTVGTSPYPDSSYQLIASLNDIQQTALNHESTDRFLLSPTFYAFKEKLQGSETIVQVLVPVVYQQNFYGLLALDLLATDMLQRFQSSLQRSIGTAMLVNNRGHVIYLPQNADQQFSSSDILNLELLEPSIWREISSTGNGSAQSSKGIFLFHQIQANSSPAQDYGHWYSVNFISHDQLLFTPFANASAHPIPLFSALAVAIVLAMVLASMRTRLESDITQLNESRYLANTTQQLSQIGNWVWHMESGKMDWSDEMFRLLDLTPNAINPTLEDYLGFVHPEDREQIAKDFKEICYSTPRALFHRIQDAAGNIRQVCLRTSGQTYFEHAQLDLVGTIQDITELKDEFMREFNKTNRHRDIVEKMQEAYILVKAIRDSSDRVIDFLYLEVNAHFEEILGLKRENVENKTVMELLPGEESLWTETLIETLTDTANSGTRKQISHFNQRQNKTFEFTAFPVQQDFIAGFFKDITQKIQRDAQFQEASKVFEATSEAIIICDRHSVITQVNKAFEKISGYSSRDVCGQPYSSLRSHRHDDEYYRIIDSALRSDQQWSGEMWSRRKNGELYPSWVNSSAIVDEYDNIQSYIYLISDISPVKEAEERLTYIAHHDILTGLANRLAFSANVEQAIEHANRHKNKIAMFYLDLDDFKQINDAMGHTAGDQCLRVVANRISNCVRANDCVARLGGDEFAIILEDLYEPQDLSNLAKKIINAVSDPIYYGGEEVFVSTSIGISVYPDDCSNAEELTQAADTAMYKVKARNPGSFEYFSGRVGITAYQNRAMENDLRRALGNGELKLFYQPQIQVNTGKIRGMEALLRWQHPTRGLILPEEILGYAKSAQLIKPLGDWVIHEVCRQVSLWKEANLPKIHISVNLSLHQFLRNHIVDTLQSAMQKHHITMKDFTLELEITEEIIHSNYGVQTTLGELQKMGVNIALENFGNILTSLRELKELPINTLKVDAKFLESLAERDDATKDSVTSAIVTTGHALGMRVIATCVETELQMQKLSSMGCDDVQGFLFSQAVSNDDIHSMLQEA